MTHRCNASTRRHAGNDETSTGFNFSVEFRRNFGVFFVFASYLEVKFRYFSVFFVFKFKNSKIFIKNSKKYDKKLGVLLSKQDQNTLKSKIICQAKIVFQLKNKVICSLMRQNLQFFSIRRSSAFLQTPPRFIQIAFQEFSIQIESKKIQTLSHELITNSNHVCPGFKTTFNWINQCL